MSNTTNSLYDSLIIGAGHSGLSVSRALAERGVAHVVLERGRVGESWRSQRWDSFMLNTPNALSLLYGDEYSGDNPEGFMSATEFAGHLDAYVRRNAIPVREGAAVTRVQHDTASGTYTVTIGTNGTSEQLRARSVIVASGMHSKPKLPAIAAHLPASITQLAAASYRNPSQLPPGAVLVVGSAQSGCQIVEDLVDAGRTVFFTTGTVGRAPRRYRGKDILGWFVDTGFLSQMRADADPTMLRMPQPQVSGVGPRGHSVSLQWLHGQGVTILGHLEGIDGTVLHIADNAAEHVKTGDDISARLRTMIDKYIAAQGIDAPPPEHDAADVPDPDAQCVDHRTSLNLADEGITTVIWTTGFTGDFSWLPGAALDTNALPAHADGISPMPGIFHVGYPWLRKRDSGVIPGSHTDAPYIADAVNRYLGRT